MDAVKLAWADYELIRFDFPFLRDKSDEDIETWIRSEYSYISQNQLLLNGIRNSPIILNERRQAKTRLIPHSYKRASVADVIDPVTSKVVGLMDLKGTGNSYFENGEPNLPPRNSPNYEEALKAEQDRDHSDGLVALDEAIAEVSRQKALQILFETINKKTGAFLQTSEIYFVLAMPMRILKNKGQRIPTAVIGRQSSWLRGHRYGVYLKNKVNKELARSYDDLLGDRQHDGFGAAIDFGAVQIAGEFELRFGMQDPKANPEFIPKESKPWLLGRAAAKAFLKGDGQAVYNHLETMLTPHVARKPSWESMSEFWDNPNVIRKLQWMTLNGWLDFQYRSTGTHLEVLKEIWPKAFKVNFDQVYNKWKLGANKMIFDTEFMVKYKESEKVYEFMFPPITP